MCGVTPQAASLWFSSSGAPHPNTLERLSQALGTQAHWLLTGEGSRELPTGAQRTAMKLAYGKPAPEESKELRLARERVEILKLQIQEAELRKKLAELEGKPAPGVTPAGFKPRREGHEKASGDKKKSLGK